MAAISVDVQQNDELRFDDNFLKYKIDLTKGKLYFSAYNTKYVGVFIFNISSRHLPAKFRRITMQECIMVQLALKMTIFHMRSV